MSYKDIAITKVVEVATWCIIFIAPMKPAMVALLILVVCDFITGIAASYKSGIPIQSAGMSRSVTKIIMYYIAIVAGLACEMVVPGVPFARVATGFVAVVELKSIYENIGYLTGTDIWKAVREYLDKTKTIGKDEGK